ncbi:MAG: hypothetical protein ACP5II_04080 [Infirmifilum sp.]|uniref:hypothetical protein n=1 Tax=Infirmifilum sp. TaxID=2856575 RepID=UPI003D0BF3C4
MVFVFSLKKLAVVFSFLAVLILVVVFSRSILQEPPVYGQAVAQSPVQLDARVAVISEDQEFARYVSVALKPKTLAVLSVSRAGEARGYDLVIIGWDALPRISEEPGFILSLLNSSRVLAVAEPRQDALTTLFSRIVKPVRLGEKGRPSDPFAFLPLVEREGYLVPGCGCSVIFLGAKRSPGGKFVVDYVAAELSSREMLPRALVSIMEDIGGSPRGVRPESLENAVTRMSVPFLQVSPTWVYIGKYTSKSYDVTGRSSGSTVGYTGFEIDAGWGSNSYDPTWHTYQWMFTLYYHRELTLKGYSPPVKVPLAWFPNTVTFDAQTYLWPSQRINRAEPGGPGRDGQISVTISYPWGGAITYTQNVNPNVTYESYLSSSYSAFYDGYVPSRAWWKWGLTSYDGSGQQYYMAALTTMEAQSLLYFKVTINANAYLYIPSLGILDTASSGEHTIYFRADTTELRAVGES